MYPNIALTGLARSGKDSVAGRLVSLYGYTRVAFADPLKEAALRTDPWVLHSAYGQLLNVGRLSDLIDCLGWETAKDRYPEVRRILQEYGQAIREMDPDFWIRAALRKVQRARFEGKPVVVSDVRYANEADALRSAGFMVVRVVRPGQAPGQHRSEREMLDYQVDDEIVNDGTLYDLYMKVDRFMR